MNKPGERDEELLAVIDAAVAGRPSKAEALEEIIAFEKEKRGLKNWHATFYPEEGNSLDAEKMASDIIASKRAHALGDFRELTPEELG